MVEDFENNKPLPFIAACNSLELGAPIAWLRLGIRDTFRAPVVSLTLGFVMAVMIMGVTVMAWNFGSAWIMFSLLCGFVFAAPIACISTFSFNKIFGHYHHQM